MAKQSGRQMAPHRLEKVVTTPENGMAPAAVEPQYLVQRAPHAAMAFWRFAS
jgi:hypothetical protein